MKRTTFLTSLLAAALGIVMAGPAGATTITWDGSTDTDFSDGDNWDTGNVPGSSDLAVIVNPAGNNNLPTLTANVTVNQMRIEKDAWVKTDVYALTINASSGLDIDDATGGSRAGLLHLDGANGKVTLPAGTHTIDGEIILSTSSSDLVFSRASPTLSGSGSIVGEHNDAQILIDEPSSGTNTLTNNITIEGHMSIERGVDAAGSAVFKNGATGTVLSNVDGGTLSFASGLALSGVSGASWDVDGNGDFTTQPILKFLAGACVNGDFLIDNCGTLTIDGVTVGTQGNVTQTAGTISLPNSGALNKRCNAGCTACTSVSAGTNGGC